MQRVIIESEQRRDDLAIQTLKELGISDPTEYQAAMIRRFVQPDRWNYDLSKHMIRLVLDRGLPEAYRSANMMDVYAYMDGLESAGETYPDVATWSELIQEEIELDPVYRPGRGDFPPIRDISHFEDVRPEELSQKDPIDLSNLSRHHDISGRRPVRDSIDDIDLPTVSDSPGATPDLDDLRSEIDRYKEDLPRPDRSKEEYRGGTSRDPGYRQRRGRGRMM